MHPNAIKLLEHFPTKTKSIEEEVELLGQLHPLIVPGHVWLIKELYPSGQLFVFSTLMSII